MADAGDDDAGSRNGTPSEIKPPLVGERGQRDETSRFHPVRKV